jgi:hypothetical protein
MEHIVSVHDLFRVLVSTNGSRLTPELLMPGLEIPALKISVWNQAALIKLGIGRDAHAQTI